MDIREFFDLQKNTQHDGFGDMAQGLYGVHVPGRGSFLSDGLIVAAVGQDEYLEADRAFGEAYDAGLADTPELSAIIRRIANGWERDAISP